MKIKVFIVVCAIFVISSQYLYAYADGPDLESAIRQYNAENYEEAIEILKKQKAVAPSTMVSFFLGMSLKQAGDSIQAAANLRDALMFSPQVSDAFAELIEVLYNMGETGEALEWVRKAEAAGVNPARIAYLKGLVLSKTERYKEAVGSFQKAKGLDPAISQQSDFQIAMLHMKEMRMADARESLRAVIAVDPMSEIASFAKEYETAIRDKGEHRAWRLYAGVSYQYDDNVVLKPSTAIPGVIITGEKDSSVVGTFRADYSTAPDGPWFLTGRFFLYSANYFHTHSHDMVVPSVMLNPGYNLSSGALSLPVLMSYTWLNGSGYESALSVRPTFSRIFAPGHIGQFSVGYSRRDMRQTAIDPDENRDADILSASASYTHTFSGERGVLNLRYEFMKDDTKGKNWENRGSKVDLSLLIPIGDKSGFTLSGGAFLQDYKNVHSIFAVKRKDRTYAGAAALTYEIIKALSLNLQYSHTTANSNIAIYDYDRNILTAGIEFRF